MNHISKLLLVIAALTIASCAHKDSPATQTSHTTTGIGYSK